MHVQRNDLFLFAAGKCDPAVRAEIERQLRDDSSPASRFFRDFDERLDSLHRVDWRALCQAQQPSPDELEDEQPPAPMEPAPRQSGRPVRTRPLRRWMVASVAVALTAWVIVCVVQLDWANGRVEAANTIAASAAARADDALRAQHEARWSQLCERIFATQSDNRHGGWFDRTWSDVRAAAQYRSDRQLQGRAAMLLAGLDAQEVASWPGMGSSRAVYGESGCLIATKPTAGAQRGRLLLWDDEARQLRELGEAPEGPFGFDEDGEIVGLFASEGDGEVALRTLEGTPDSTTWSLPDDYRVGDLELALLDRRGRRLVVVAESPTGARLLVLQRGNSDELANFRVAGLIRSTAISDDGELVAAGTTSGHVYVWNVSTRTSIGVLRSGRSEVGCLAFADDKLIGGFADDAPEGQSNLLAAGDASGTLTLWDLRAGIPRTYFRASHHAVLSVAFSPDGMTVASAGRGQVRLWDLATGRLLLTLAFGDHFRALAFSPSGQQLVVGGVGGSADPVTSVWRLTTSRGMRALRGLSAQVARVAISPDNTQIAALSHDWRVAVWSANNGALDCIFNATKGDSADNAAIAFSADGQQVAVAASESAETWNLATRRRTVKWSLSQGRHNLLAHTPTGFRIFREETIGGSSSGGVPADKPFATSRKVFRVRDLIHDGTTSTLADVRDFMGTIHTAATAPDGSWFVIDGMNDHEQSKRTIAAYDANGNLLGNTTSEFPFRYGVVSIDPLGESLAALAVTIAGSPRQYATFVFTSRHQHVRKISQGVVPAVGPHADQRLIAVGETVDGGTLLRVETPAESFFVVEDREFSSDARFSRDGQFIVWGNGQGYVVLCDIAGVSRQMRDSQLTWK